MNYSTYQVQRLMTLLRRGRDRFGGSPKGDASSRPGGFDRVLLSERAKAQAAEIAASIRLPAGPAVSTATIVDDSPLPLPTRIELERRAGSFMHPPQKPTPGPIPIPRVRKIPDIGGAEEETSARTRGSSSSAQYLEPVHFGTEDD